MLIRRILQSRYGISEHAETVKTYNVEMTDDVANRQSSHVESHVHNVDVLLDL